MYVSLRMCPRIRSSKFGVPTRDGFPDLGGLGEDPTPRPGDCGKRGRTIWNLERVYRGRKRVDLFRVFDPESDPSRFLSGTLAVR